MGRHEEELLELLQKVGQAPGDPVEPAVLDADAPAPLETAGPSESPAPVEETEMVGPPQDQSFASITRKNLWVHHDSHVVPLDIALMGKYQEDWFTWEPETVWREIRDDFRVPSIADHVKSKVQAAKTLHISEAFWKQWEVFCWLNQSFNNKLPDFRILQKPSIPQLVNTVETADLIRTGESFGLEVQSFVAASMVEEGVFYAPSPIKFCQDEISHLLEDKGIENHREITRAVQERYNEIISLPEETWLREGDPILQENVIDIQVAKLKVAWDYLAMRRRQMREQLKLL